MNSLMGAREALWEARLHTRSSRNGQAASPVSTEDSVPPLLDFTEREKMLGGYRVTGIYTKGRLMEIVRPRVPVCLCVLAPTHIREAKRELEMAIVMGGDKGLLRKSDCRSVKGDCRFTEPPATSRRWYHLPST